jgi:hypothetical protein
VCPVKAKGALRKSADLCNNVVGMVSLDKWKYTSNSHDANMPTDDEILSADRFWRVQDILRRRRDPAIYDGLGAGEQGSSTLMDPTQRSISEHLFKQLELGALVLDPMTQELIYTMGALLEDNTNLNTWKDGLLDPGKLWRQTQVELHQ